MSRSNRPERLCWGVRWWWWCWIWPCDPMSYGLCWRTAASLCWCGQRMPSRGVRRWVLGTRNEMDGADRWQGLEYGCFIFIFFIYTNEKRNVHIIIHKSNRHTVLCRPTHGIPQPCSCCWSWVVVVLVVVVVVVRLGGTLFGLWANCSLRPSHPGNLASRQKHQNVWRLNVTF